MGGNALKNCETRRYAKEEYHALESEVIMQLKALLRTSVLNIPAYDEKETFGDLDLLVSSDNLPGDWKDRIISIFKPKEWVSNGNVFSFEYKDFQVDLIVTPHDKLWYSRLYFAYNDLGNLVGRVAHSMGLKFGHDGLFYTWKDGTEVYATHLITDDWDEALAIVGYDPERYQEGFPTLESIFNFVASSKFFSKEIYSMENRNHANRVRDAKRKTYNAFLEWCGETELPSFPYRSKDEWRTYLRYTLDSFAALDTEVQAQVAKDKEFKERFNGDLVSQIACVTGRELGEVMKWLKAEHPDLKQKILVMNPVVVPRWIEFQVNKYKGLK